MAAMRVETGCQSSTRPVTSAAAPNREGDPERGDRPRTLGQVGDDVLVLSRHDESSPFSVR